MSKPLIVKCPKCRNELDYYTSPFRPFCSERCKVIDLGDWASGKYAVPTEDMPFDEESIERSNEKSSSTEED